MWSEKRSGELWDEGRESRYVVTVDDIVLLAARAGVGMNKQAAQEWLAEDRNRAGIEAAINIFIMNSVRK